MLTSFGRLSFSILFVARSIGFPCQTHQRLTLLLINVVTFYRGQQISWKAAMAIKHKFVRLFDPSLPENVSECKCVPFP